MITIKSLNKKFGTQKVLNNVNLQFEKGTIYGIIGENGAGKTTLFNCIAETLSYDGEILSEKKPLRNYLGYLPSELFFFKRMTGREYVQLMCNARQVPVNNIDSKNIFDLPLDKYISTYSTGMKKKLAFMAIIMQNSEYYILDEPFNGVDIQNNIVISNVITKMKQLGKCVIMSSHILSTLTDTCDVILKLDKGTISRTFYRDEFSQLEKEYKTVEINNKVDSLFF